MQGDRARPALAGSRFADIRWVPETGSTNEDLLVRARGGEPHDVVLVADHQTAGRGRLGRVWQAPPGSSLLVSVLLHPPLAADEAHLASTALACAAADACTEVVGAYPDLKWPNDLVIGQPDGTVRKLGGVLAESVVDGGQLRAVVVGLGLNLNWPDEVPEELDGIAVSLNHVVHHPVDAEDVLIALLQRLDDAVSGFDSPNGVATLLHRYRELCSTPGSRVRVEMAGESFEGLAREVDGHGHLRVTTDSGDDREVTAGDVVHLRAIL